MLKILFTIRVLNFSLDQTTETCLFLNASLISKRKKTSIKLLFSLQKTQYSKKILYFLTFRLIEGKKPHITKWKQTGNR